VTAVGVGVPVAELGTATLLVGTAELAPSIDDDGLVGDDVCAHPTANTVPTTTTTAKNEDGTDIDNSFSIEQVDESCRLKRPDLHAATRIDCQGHLTSSQDVVVL